MAPEFTKDWVLDKPKHWKRAIDASPFPIEHGLEIGVFEGRSTLWFLDTYFQKEGVLHSVDRRPQELFWKNCRDHLGIGRLVIENRPSIEVLPRLVTTSRGFFDFAYIDGSHYCWDVLFDLVMVFQCVKVGAVIICDDYIYDTPRKDVTNWEYERPEWAIDAFERCMGPKLKIEPAHRRQRIFRKVSE